MFQSSSEPRLSQAPAAIAGLNPSDAPAPGDIHRPVKPGRGPYIRARVSYYDITDPRLDPVKVVLEPVNLHPDNAPALVRKRIYKWARPSAMPHDVAECALEGRRFDGVLLWLAHLTRSCHGQNQLSLRWWPPMSPNGAWSGPVRPRTVDDKEPFYPASLRTDCPGELVELCSALWMPARPTFGLLGRGKAAPVDCPPSSQKRDL